MDTEDSQPPLHIDAAVAAIDAADSDALHCPLCGYSLHGLPDPRCPECGYAFTWAGLRAEMRRRESWFFEHAGTNRSFWQTRWRSLRPRKFWGELKPAWSIETDRLHFYLITTFGLTIGIFIGFYLLLPVSVLTIRNIILVWQGRGSVAILATPSVFNEVLPPEFFRLAFASLGLSLMAMACLTHPFWLILSWSTVQRAIRPRQLLRATAYILDPLPWMMTGGIAWLTVVASAGWWQDFLGLSFFLGQHDALAEHALLLTALGIVIVGYRIAVASRKYLHLPHAAGIGLAYVLIVGLTWMIAALYLAEMARW